MPTIIILKGYLMNSKKISFIPSKSKDELKEIVNFNVQAFADSHDFAWTENNVKNELASGWEVFSVKIDKDIICALFVKKDGENLLTKNTPLKMNYQGQGYSHIIKEFYEEYAKENKLGSVYNYCPVDNFRMISLNEGHDYHKTGETLGSNTNMIEWNKKL